MRHIRLIQLPIDVLDALAEGDLAAANRIGPVRLGAYFVGPECRGTWRRRALQVAEDPASAVWITRVIVDAETGLAVGRAGFHGPPDLQGRVEVGYAVDPPFRRRGYARAALAALLDWARDDPAVATVRAAVSPENLPSLALVHQFGFVEVGAQWDDEDGPETVFERPSKPG